MPYSAKTIIGNITTESKQLGVDLSIGLSRAQRVDMLETFIQSTLVELTQLASQVTNSLAVGEIVIVRDSTETWSSHENHISCGDGR